MSIYYKIFKFSYKMMPPAMLSYLVIIILTVLMKIFDAEAYIVFGKVDSVLVLVFVNLFGLGCILNFIILILCLKLSLNTPIFHSVPGIRSKIMNYSLIHLLFYFTWFVFIVGGLKEPELISFLFFLNLYFLSLITSAFFFDSISVYRSGKYFILKLMYYIIGIIGIFAIPQFQDKHPIATTIFYAGFAAVIIYQAVSFRRNYIDFNLKESSYNGFENTIRSIEKYFESMPEKSLRKRIAQSEKSKDKYRDLFEITIFGVNHPLIYLLYPWVAAMLFGLIIDHEGMIPFLSVIPLIAGSYLSLTIGNKDKITFLYTTSGLSRKEFVNKVLQTVLRKYFIVFLPLLPFMILYTIIYNEFTGVMEYHVPVILFVFILAAWLILTWIIWMAVLQFADFDKLKSINSESLFSRMRFRK
jgi:hypothetical protein